jgi:hypothetical protein
MFILILQKHKEDAIQPYLLDFIKDKALINYD